MNKFRQFWCLCFLFLTLAYAQPTSSSRFAVTPGYGPGTPTEVGSSDGKTLQPYGLGLGARIEYVFKSGISIGVFFAGHRGESAELISIYGIPYTLTTRMVYGGFEVGYFIPLGVRYGIHSRLGVGLGEPVGNFSTGRADPDLPGFSVEGPRPYVSPGLGVSFELNTHWFAGIDVRYLALAEYRNANSFLIFAIIGFKIPINC